MTTKLVDAPVTVVTEPRLGERAPFAAMAYVALSLAVAMEALRVLLPVTYAYQGDAGVARTAAVLAVIMIVPAFAPVVTRRAGFRRTMVASAVAMVLVRLALQAVGEIGLLLAGVMVAVALFAVVAALLRLSHEPVLLAASLVAGLALNALLRGATLTWDLAWRPGAWPFVVVGLVGVALIVAGARAASATPDAGCLPARAAFAFGPYLFFQVLFVQSPAYVASSAGVALATAIAVVLLGDLAALVAASVAARGVGRSATAVASVVLAFSAWALTGWTGARVLALVVLVQFLATLLLTGALQPAAASRPTSTAKLVLATAAGLLVFCVLLLEYQLHYDTPLPFSNRWLPVVAALAMAVAGISGRSSTRHDAARDEAAGRDAARRWIPVVAGAIVIAGAGVAAALVLSEPDIATSAAAGSSIRVMTYNVDETVSRHGRLDPATLVAAVEQVDPDVLVVPESGRGWPISATFDLAEWAKRQLGMRYVWAPAADHQFGTLLFSRLPIERARVVPLPQGAGTMRRSAIIAEVGPVNDHPVTVVATHLQNGSTAVIKQTRFEEIGVLLAEWADAPRTIIAGDLNADPGSLALHRIQSAGFSTTQPASACTLKTSNNNCVDWVLVTPDLQQGPPTVLPIDTYDHRPLTATVAVP